MNIIRCNSCNDPGPDIYAKITMEEYEAGEGIDGDYIIVHGRELLLQIMVPTGKKPLSALVDKKILEEPESMEVLEMCGDIPIYVTDFAEMGVNEVYHPSPNIFALYEKPKLRTPEELCKDAKRICVMERTLLMSNIGAVIRSAQALGIDAVLMTSDCINFVSKKGIRVARTAMFIDTWTIMPPVDDLVEYLHGLGFKTAGMTLSEDSVTLKDPDLRQEERLAIIMGSEHDGLNPKTEADCDYRVYIPINRVTDSLNVTQAATIAFYELGNVTG
ncbi:MAG: RNA methyltransferase [Firmicutes bacterium]|nr:RNA methyltransferase [Bacillota bacterium]